MSLMRSNPPAAVPTLEELQAQLLPADATVAAHDKAIAWSIDQRQALLAGLDADAARRSATLLRVDDATLKAADEEVAAARLAVERINIILPMLGEQRKAAAARETITALRKAHAALDEPTAELERWQQEDLPAISQLIAAGLRAHDAAYGAIERFKADVAAAYQRPEVRNAGALGVDLPILSGALPRHLFPTWQLRD